LQGISLIANIKMAKARPILPFHFSHKGRTKMNTLFSLSVSI
jgi:hypothetical protein